MVSRGFDQSGWSVDFGGVAADISSMADRTAPFTCSVEQVITIAHSDPTLSLTADVPSQVPPGPSGVLAGGALGSPGAQADVAMSGDAPGDEHAEPKPGDREAIESITVDGTVIARESTLRLMCAACVALGLSKSGSRARCWDRVEAASGSSDRACPECRSVPTTLKAPPIAQTPSEADIRQHELTHEPFQAWCRTCVKFRARQDKHQSEHQRADTGRTTISMDFGYLSREPEAEDQLTCLFFARPA